MGAEGVRVAYPLFQAEGGGSTPTSALQLRFEITDLRQAIALNRLWHSRLPLLDSRVAGWLCYAAECDGVHYAAAVWGLPIARLLPQDGSWLELRRLAIAPDAPRNAASRMLGWMARDICKRCPGTTRLISHHDTEVHTGCIYRAAGWTATTVHDGHGFDKSPRGRPKPQTEAPKQRWEKQLSAIPADVRAEGEGVSER